MAARGKGGVMVERSPIRARRRVLFLPVGRAIRFGQRMAVNAAQETREGRPMRLLDKTAIVTGAARRASASGIAEVFANARARMVPSWIST